MAEEEQDLSFDRLELLFRRSWSLPPLPQVASSLAAHLDRGTATTNDLEQIINAEPGIATNLIRTANRSEDGFRRSASTVRWALLRTGPQVLRSLITTLNIGVGPKMAGRELRVFDALHYAKHSSMVAYLARHVYVRRSMSRPFRSAWSEEEVYAAGLLHDFAYPLLAKVAPNAYKRVVETAKENRWSLSLAFASLYGRRIDELAVIAAESWSLPPVFIEAIQWMDRPLEHENEFIPLCCLNYAHYLATARGYGLETWPVENDVTTDILDEVCLGEEEIDQTIELAEDSTVRVLPTDRRPKAA